jgi:uncharacterized iron-regulated protein
MKYTILAAFFLFCAFTADKKAYQLFSQTGKPVAYEQLVTDALAADIVLFGELHNNPICHWLELQLLKDLHAEKQAQLVVGAEMFEADDQVVLNEYLQRKITGRSLETEAKVWNNYTTDYKPLLEFALNNNLPFVATNIPRRYASMVAKSDLAALDSLGPEVKNWMAPLPIEVDVNLPGYKKMMNTGGENGMAHAHGINMRNLAKAQAIKDATMAHFILANWQPGKTFLHINGSYHSDNFEGIVWYLKKQNPQLKILTISSVEQADVSKLQDKSRGLATYILAIPSDMTKTY